MIFALSFATLSNASVDSLYEVAIVAIKGDVQVDVDGDVTWIRPWIGMKLREDALIKTGANSMVDIVFDAEGLNLVRIKENSLTTVQKALLELPDGAVLVSFANLKPGSSFTIKTPAAACAIRGSIMGVRATGEGTEGMAFKGNLYIQPLDPQGNPVGGEHTLPAGEQAGVGKDGKVGKAKKLGKAALGEFHAFQSGSGPGDGGDAGSGTGDGEEPLDTKDLDDIRVKGEDEDDKKCISPTDEQSRDEFEFSG